MTFIQTKGELNVEKKEKYEQSINFYKKLIENTETFSDLIGEPMPELPIDGSRIRIIFFFLVLRV